MSARFCVRCGTVPEMDDSIAPRIMFATALIAELCDDCNNVVQGPDHADPFTRNLAIRLVR